MRLGASPRIFTGWWLVLIMAALFVALAVACAFDGNWVGFIASFAFAGLMVLGALEHRRRLLALEAALTSSVPPLGRGDLEYLAQARALNRFLLTLGVLVGTAMVVWAFQLAIR
jgi:hypothetical protein